MSLIVCQGCSKEHSPNITKCPHCGHEANKIMKPCRVCGANLPADYHRFVNAYSTWGVSNGESYTSTAYQFLHRPCTNCGEPYPLQCKMDNPWVRGIVKLLFIAIGAILGLAVFTAGVILISELKLNDWFLAGAIILGLLAWPLVYISLRRKFIGY